MFNKENKKLYGVLVWVIIALLGFILILLIFKTGMMIGGSKSHFSSCKANYSHKNFSGHMGGKLGIWKKSSFLSYQAVVSLTESGFVAKGSDGEEQTVVITEDTKIIKGKGETENGVSVGDKVYVDGSSDEGGQVVADTVKIYGPSLIEFKKWHK